MTTFAFSVPAPTGIIYSVDLQQIADMSLSQLSHLSCAVYQIECDGHPLDANQTLFDKAHRAMTSWAFDLDCDGLPAPTEQEQLDYFIGQLHAVLTPLAKMANRSIHDLYAAMDTAARNMSQAKDRLESAQQALEAETQDDQFLCDYSHAASLLNEVERCEDDVYYAGQHLGAAMMAHSEAIAAKRAAS